MKRVYLCGQVTGLKKEVVIKNFADAKCLISDRYGMDNVIVVNPLELNRWDFSEKQCMKNCLNALIDCDIIAVQSNYLNSKGALCELALAEKLGLEIIYGCEIDEK